MRSTKEKVKENVHFSEYIILIKRTYVHIYLFTIMYRKTHRHFNIINCIRVGTLRVR